MRLVHVRMIEIYKTESAHAQLYKSDEKSAYACFCLRAYDIYDKHFTS